MRAVDRAERALVDVEGGNDPQRLLIGTVVNGERRQADTSKMIFDIRTLIETVSRCMTLRPGILSPRGRPRVWVRGWTRRGG